MMYAFEQVKAVLADGVDSLQARLATLKTRVEQVKIITQPYPYKRFQYIL